MICTYIEPLTLNSSLQHKSDIGKGWLQNGANLWRPRNLPFQSLSNRNNYT